MSSVKETMFKKRAHTSAMSGQLFKTKLVSLVLFKMLHDERFEYFYLTSNMDEIGSFDDICFKVKLKGIDRPVLVFMQAKHKDDDNSFVDFDNATSFHDSYLKVMKKFHSYIKDKFFSDKFDENECIFILYTNAKHTHDSNIQLDNVYANTLNDLLATGKGGTHLHYTDKIVETVAETTLNEEVASLAEHFTKFLTVNKKQTMQILLDHYMLRYHVLLATSVVNISSIQCDEQNTNSKWRILKFREEFFETNDATLMLLQKAIFKQIWQHKMKEQKYKKHDHDPKAEEKLRRFFGNPCASTLSTVIGTLIEHKDDALTFIYERTQAEILNLQQINLSQVIIKEAEAIAARHMLLSLEIKVPVTFGNIDFMISETRLPVFIDNVVNLCKNFKLVNGHKTVTLDESAADELLCVDGGLAGTVGYLLVYDKDTKLLKFANNCNTQQSNAAIVLKKLKRNIADWHQYRFHVKATIPFPKLSFDCSEMAKEILEKLVIYSQQSNQNKLQELLTKQIKDFEETQNLQVQPDTIFLNYHAAVQTWWLLKTEVSYFTKETQIYLDAIKNIIREPFINSLNTAFNMSKIKNIEYTTEALDTLQRLTNQKEKTNDLTLAEKAIIVTDVTTLTTIKVTQFLNYKGINNYALLDLSCTINLSTDDFCALKVELNRTSKYIIIICEQLQNGVTWYEKYLKEIAHAIRDKPKVVITDSLYLNIVMNAFLLREKENIKTEIENNEIIYEHQSLIDFTQDSQNNIMKNRKVIFQGQLIDLNLLLDNNSLGYIKGPVLNKVVLNETIKLGAEITDTYYDEISCFYQDRSVEYFDSHLVSGKICVTAVDYMLGDISPRKDIDSFLIIDLLEDPNNHTHYSDPSDSKKGPFYIDFVFACCVNIKKLEHDLGANGNTGITLRTEDAVLYQLSFKNDHIKDKVWIVKITLFDCIKLYDKWQKDKKTDKDTLNTLRNMCKVILHDIMIRYDSSILSQIPGALNAHMKNSFTDVSNLHTISYLEPRLRSPTQDSTKTDPPIEIGEDTLVILNNDKLINLTYSYKLDSNSYQHLGPVASVNSGVSFNNENGGNENGEQAILCKNETFNYKEEIASCGESDISLKDFIHRFSKNSAEWMYSIVPNVIVSLYDDESENFETSNNISLPNTIIALPWNHKQSKLIDSPVYKFRINYNYKYRMNVKTFNDIKQNVVLLTAKAGSGKSTLLTHLSRKQNKLEDNVWIVRINLVKYSEKFSQWHRDNIVISTLQTLKFMCQVILQNKNAIVNLKESCNKVYLENCSGDAWDRFNLNMFLHYYNEKKLLILFDGFDEICPDYVDEVIKLLKVVKHFPRSNKMWITTRPYNFILSDLEQHFGNSLTLTYFTKTEQSQYLSNFWNEFIIRNSKYEERKMQDVLLGYMSVIYTDLDIKLKLIGYDFYNFYCSKYLLLKSTYYQAYREKIETAYRSLTTSVSRDMMSDTETFLRTPLLLYLSAKYFLNRILDSDQTNKNHKELETNAIFSGINMYKYFVEMKLRKILFSDKCGLNVDIPYINETCELELQESITIHKKLGAHAIFGSPLFTKFGIYLDEFKELTPFQLDIEAGKEDFNSVCGRILVGQERTGLVTHVTNDGVPVFIHKVLAEYFAFEYICDTIKSKKFDDKSRKILCYMLVLTTGEYKVKDGGDVEVTRNNMSTWMSLKRALDRDLDVLIRDVMSDTAQICEYVKEIDASRLVSFYMKNYMSEGFHPGKFKAVGVKEI